MEQTLKRNEIIRHEISGISNEGYGVGRFNGMAVFVPMTADGDEIDAKIVKVLKNHAFAIIEKIITPSEHRILNDCGAYRRCGGCSLRHIGYEHELEVKSGWLYENLRRIGGVDLDKVVLDNPIASPCIERYRNKAQYPVRRVSGRILTGFFAKRSHELVPIEDCMLQPVFFSDIIQVVVDFMGKNAIEPYDEESGNGLLRHIFIRYAEATDEAMLCLVINAPELPHADKLTALVKYRCPKVKTLVINENRKKTNVILGDKTTTVFGSGYITDILCGVKVRLSAESFYQVNKMAAEQLYLAAKEYAAPEKNDILLDLYCGTGTIGLSMAHSAGEVIGVEAVSAAIADAKVNAEQNGIKNMRFICADAADAAEKLKAEGINPDIIILDPPRKGADEKLPAIIAGLSPKKLVYISCNSATLARDISRLVPLGYKLDRVRAVDLFPRTAHVECVALMTKAEA